MTVMLTDVRVPPLSWKGALFLAMVGILFTAAQSTIVLFGEPWPWGPDLGLILVLYMGLNVPLAAGAMLGCLVGLMRDAACGGIFGQFAAVYLAVFLVVNQVRKKIDPSAPYYLLLFVFLCTVLTGFLNGLMLLFLGQSIGLPKLSADSPAVLYFYSALLSGIIGPVCFQLIDVLKPKDAPASDQEP